MNVQITLTIATLMQRVPTPLLEVLHAPVMMDTLEMEQLLVQVSSCNILFRSARDFQNVFFGSGV